METFGEGQLNGEGQAMNKQLLREAEKFDFFRAVRILERKLNQGTAEERRNKIGHDSNPANEVVHFKANQSLAFPNRTVHTITPREDQPELVDMIISFMGLTGTKGVLPDHYTETILQRMKIKDHSMKDFFDLFNHRLISLFYRAWEKYNIHVQYEGSLIDKNNADHFSRCLGSLTGALQNDFDSQKLYYGGLFARHVRSASALKGILTDFLGSNVDIKQFQGQWLYLNNEDKTIFPGKKHRKGQYNQLSKNMVLGKRVWDNQSKFTIIMHTKTLKRFTELLPDTEEHKVLCKMVRHFAGNGMNFDLKIMLPASEVPACRLYRGKEFTPRLGWNTWTKKRKQQDVLKHTTFHINAHG